jgi:hypothetical protein
MARRRKGLQHMISTEDKILFNCCPPDIIQEEYTRNCELAVNTPELHSDEWSSNDEELANGERNDNKRPERLKNVNSVIKIHDKKWRSTRVCKVVKLFKKYNIYV